MLSLKQTYKPNNTERVICFKGRSVLFIEIKRTKEEFDLAFLDNRRVHLPTAQKSTMMAYLDFVCNVIMEPKGGMIYFFECAKGIIIVGFLRSTGENTNLSCIPSVEYNRHQSIIAGELARLQGADKSPFPR